MALNLSVLALTEQEEAANSGWGNIASLYTQDSS